PGGFHHGSGHRKAQKKTGYMAAIPVHFIQEKHWHHRERPYTPVVAGRDAPWRSEGSRAAAA
ncbi:MULTISPECIES: hypothetical protein, partial [unclassified Serratia (in: enterobacteria)]|uniref:hypothetical protein n=1 Tax=unclassified Serratia (in: enterobacteria) TaxID=2647522 RepID=UPI0030763703